jgi:hypothetical protein
MKERLSLTFGIMCAVIFGWALWDSRGYHFLDGIGPWFACGIGLVLSLISVVRQSNLLRRMRIHNLGSSQMSSSEFSADGVATSGEYWRSLTTFGVSVLALYIGVALVGLPIAFVIFLVVYLRLEGHVRWPILILSVVIGLGFLVYLAYFLEIFWPESLILNWVKLPRLLGGK